MLELAIMIEGQNGLNWQRGQRIARAVEDLGFAGLYRSDHYTNANPPDLDSLECWVSLTWLATNTKRIEFGPLVTPMSFRHPTMTARMASAVDDLSRGRLTLGLGAGWQEREHANYGWELLEIKERFERFGDGLEIITRLFNSDAPMTYDGKYYHARDAVLLPRPHRRIPILIGGNGEKRTLALVARYASEWNAMFQTPTNFARLSARLDELLAANKRAPRAERSRSVRRSMMTGCVFGKDDAEVQRKVAARKRSAAELRERGIIVGAASEVVDQLGALADAGVQRVMLQWLDLDDLDGLEALARDVLPKCRTN
ncbi:MAG: LLM class F420-dependent oxidoreductase [Chloroflexota bacterium]|nr:LLM class F420-dependent oxidoreductase [Chloroflexota bacterium]